MPNNPRTIKKTPKSHITYSDVLDDGFILHWYEIRGVLGRGSFGVTYLAWDKNLNQQVAIKEYFPRDFSSRDSGSTVYPSTGESRELFEWGLVRFIREAQTLAQFKHHNIVRVMSVFELNNTAYMVMEYEKGKDLSTLYKQQNKQQKKFSEQALLNIFIPILNGLKLVHDAGFTHRDIKPANIYIRSDGSPVLIDFGSARKTTGAATRSITSLVTHGYAPFEQYNEGDDKQGPWTDIYALGACLYCAIDGKSPLNALTRGANFISNGLDGYEPLLINQKDEYSENFLLAIDNALLFQGHERPQDVVVWADMLSGKIILSDSHVEGETTVVLKKPYNIPSKQVINLPKTQLNIKSKHINLQKPNGQTPLPFFKSIAKQAKQWVIALVVVIIGGAVSFFINDNDVNKTLVTTNDAQLVVLLKAADNARRAGNLIESKNSAVYLYQKALKFDADNSEATSRIRDILEHYNAAIKRDINSGDYEKAQTNVQLLLMVGIDTAKINQLKNEIEQARKNKQKIDDLLQQANANLINRKSEDVERNIADILNIDPNSQDIVRLRAKIKANNQVIENKIKQAQRAFGVGNMVYPKNDNALVLYQSVLKLDPENSRAKNGLTEINQYFSDQFDKNLKRGYFKSAKKTMLKVEKYLPESQLANYMRNAYNEKKNDYDLNLKAVKKLIEEFKNKLELKDIEGLKKISQLKSDKKNFLAQIFEHYVSFKIKVSNVKYANKDKKGSARLRIYNLINLHGNAVTPGTWGKFGITIRKKSGKNWKVFW